MDSEIYPPAAQHRPSLLGPGSPARWFLLIIVIAVGLWAYGLSRFAASISSNPPQLASAADGIVVLTGGAERVHVAFDLLKGGKAQRLLISGVHTTTDASDLAAPGTQNADLIKCCVDIGREARNTRGNASEGAKWARDHKYQRLIIVTSDYHMPRALIEFHSASPNLELIAWPVRPPDFDVHAWWRNPTSIRVLSLEYSKYLVASIRVKFGRKRAAPA